MNGPTICAQSRPNMLTPGNQRSTIGLSVCAHCSVSPKLMRFRSSNGTGAHTPGDRSSLGLLRFWPTVRADTSSVLVLAADEKRDIRAYTPPRIPACPCGTGVDDAASGGDSASSSKTRRSATSSLGAQVLDGKVGYPPWGSHVRKPEVM